MAAGTSTPSFPLFSVTVDLPYTDPLGIQTGTLTILGGVEIGGTYNPTVQDFLGSASFNVNVSTPEPSTFRMMARQSSQESDSSRANADYVEAVDPRTKASATNIAA